MKGFGVATPAGIPATTPEEAEAAFNTIRAGRRTFLSRFLSLWMLEGGD